MIRGIYIPMEILQNWQIYRLKIHYNTIVPDYVTWIQPDYLLYKHIQFTIDDFRGFVHGMTAATRQILSQELLFGQIPVIPWHALYDDPTQGTVG